MYRLLAAISVVSVAGVCGKPVEVLTAAKTEDYPRYAFNYAVSDPYTKDNKAQWEERDGDVVKGAYSLREPDGNLRIVEYSASNAQGFNAVVKKIGASVHPITVPQTAVKAVPLPAIVAAAAPLVPIKPVIPITYGLGPAAAAIDLPKSTLYGRTSLPWDPLTSSYGGWTPLPTGPHAYIISRKYVDGNLEKRVIGPISLTGNKLIIRTTKQQKIL